MPKKSKKDKVKNFSSAADDEDETNSLTSGVSDSIYQNSEDEPENETEAYENKLKMALDLASETSMDTRVNALVSFGTGLRKRVVTQFLLGYAQTLTDVIEKSLRKGVSLERIAAAKLAAVANVSLISTDEADKMYEQLAPILSSVASDPACSAPARREAASSLAFTTFVAAPDAQDLPATMNVLHDIFCAALPKGNGEFPNVSSAMSALHVSALQGVCLLLSLMSKSAVYSMASKLLDEVRPMLVSSDLDMRIAVGECLAFVYECAREHDDGYRWKGERELLNTLEDLMSESHKYVAKKNKKTQRSSFRDVIQSIKHCESPSQAVLIGPSKFQQELLLDSWALKFQYQALCRSLEEGVNLHMTYNAPLRDRFDLGPPPNIDLSRSKPFRAKKPNRQAPAARQRILARNKNRDKRAAALHYDD